MSTHKILLEHNHAYLLTYCLSFKYLLSGPSQRKFADPWSKSTSSLKKDH